MINRTAEEMVAYALEMDPELLQYAPELLADLEELGSDAELIVEVLGTVELPAGAEVLDLGCGKGSVAVEIADEIGLSVRGVDLFAPFIESAQAAALEAQVSHLCRFECADLVEVVRAGAAADVVIYAALGDLLGPLDETVGLLRNAVKPDGYLLLSDCFVKDGGSSSYPGFASCVERTESRRRIESHGDTIVAEVAYNESLPSVDAADEIPELDESAFVLERARALAQRFPHASDKLLRFARSQLDEEAFIAANLEPVIWLVKKTAP